jgi:nucleoside-diphosphate-sugar epimerase
MRIFVAGGTGVVGRRAVERLLAAGHSVTVVARTPEKAARAASLGAEPVQVSLFDRDALTAAVARHDVVVNLATHIPHLRQAAMPGAWAENDRIRTEGAANLAYAALAAGATRFVQESITFTYPDSGDAWIDEDTPIDTGPSLRSVAAAEASAHRFTEGGGTGIVLRFGLFYAPDAAHTEEQIGAARRGIGAVVGDVDAYQSMIHADDAAAAVVAALGAPAGTYNVVESEPSTKRAVAEAVGAAVGRRPRVLVPGKAAKLAGKAAAPLARSQRVSNRRFVAATGWEPAFPSVQTGMPAVVAAMPPPPKPPLLARLVRPAAVLLTLSALSLGLWALLDPAGFYESFPFGRGWVAADGPYNEHLIRDFGSLHLALAVLYGAAALWPERRWVRVAALAALVDGVPHLTYHALNLDPYETADAIATILALVFALVLPVVMILGTATPSRGDRNEHSHPEASSPSTAPDAPATT